jgi:2-polyprenyl-3-methyl-5-hydroxy-6-metoxy-1,4-benzoquinol methylase
MRPHDRCAGYRSQVNERWPAYLFKADRSGPLDYLCEFDHADLERARRSVLWHGEWERQTGQAIGALAGFGLLRDGLRVLDFGCGVGRVTSALLERHQLTVRAVDRARSMRQHAAAELAEHIAAGRVSVTSDAELLAEAPPPVFDVVLLVEVAQHIPEPLLDELLPRLRTMLAPGGRVFIWGNQVLDVDAHGRVSETAVAGVVDRHLRVLRADRWDLEPQVRHSLLCAP